MGVKSQMLTVSSQDRPSEQALITSNQQAPCEERSGYARLGAPSVLNIQLVSKCMVEPYGLIIDRPVLSLVHIASYLNFTSLLYYCYTKSSQSAISVTTQHL